MKLREWGLKIEDPESAFKIMDPDNGGFILFDNFSHFCITQHIDFQTQNDEDQEALKGLEKDEKDPSKVKYKHYRVKLFSIF